MFIPLQSSFVWFIVQTLPPVHFRAFGRPVTPSDCLSSECMSSSGESDAELPPSEPTRRDPALLIERLESSKKRIGRAKRRRAANGKSLWALSENFLMRNIIATKLTRIALQKLHLLV